MKEEPLEQKKERLTKILSRLAGTIPDPQTELDFRNPFELLVATVLSAQTTDLTVNRVTPRLFSRFPTPAALAEASISELEILLRPTGFFRRKAQHVKELAQALATRYQGNVPGTMEELVTLPGVGRKTASVVLFHGFSRPAIFVDTHVGRVSKRLGLTASDDPERVERDLAQLIPEKDWGLAASRLLLHGRRVCLARRPLCEKCPCTDLCPAFPAVISAPLRRGRRRV
ncbi:MAG: endonuclease III [Leptospirillia bacterium]